ncbi:MAG: ORF6N domain-containing protein [Elusimicrobia bacterium]|nr:ORF6N domain-containing protein [Elusimicrobiota bacterium]
MKDLIITGEISRRILVIRGHKVMLDADLAQLYGVPTGRLNEQVRRNTSRFPNDFMFQLTAKEADNLKSHFATSSSGWGGRRKLPLVFTQEGVAMLSGILNSKRAVQVNIEIMRAFVHLRQIVASNKDLARRLDELEAKYDAQFKIVFREIREQLEPPATPKPRIGFRPRGQRGASGRGRMAKRGPA